MKRKNVVFISVPMAGKADALIERAILVTKRKYLEATQQDIKDVVFVDNFQNYEQIQIPDGADASIIYLGEAIKKLATCDVAVFGKSWRDARGCMIEHEVCTRYGINIFEINEF